MTVRDAAEIERALAALGRGNGLVVVNDTFTASNRKAIIALASQYQLPAVYGLHRRSASYIDRILKGENPANLPIQQPTKYELVINMKTAKALGLTIC